MPSTYGQASPYIMKYIFNIKNNAIIDLIDSKFSVLIYFDIRITKILSFIIKLRTLNTFFTRVRYDLYNCRMKIFKAFNVRFSPQEMPCLFHFLIIIYH